MAQATAAGGRLVLPVVTATLGGLLFGYDTAVISGAIGAIDANFIDPRGLGATARDSLSGFTVASALIGTIIGAAIAGMLATRFSLMYPETVTHLVLENAIGLEDYREQVPWVPTDRVYKGVLAETEDSIRTYHKAYYVTWKPEFEEFVTVHARLRGSAQFPQHAWVRALVVQMIYEQPVVHELPRLRVPTR